MYKAYICFTKICVISLTQSGFKTNWNKQKRTSVFFMLLSTDKTDAVRFQWFATHCQNWESYGHRTIFNIIFNIIIVMITSADARPGTIRKITAPGRFYTVKTKFKYNVYINIRIRHYTFNKNSKSGSDGGENHTARTVAVKLSRFKFNQNRPVPNLNSISLQNAVEFKVIVHRAPHKVF